MTNAEEIIMRAVAALIEQGKKDFSRREVQDQVGVDRGRWMANYTSIFQGMRVDHPGGAPRVREKFRGVFRRVERGRYVLTGYGKQLLKQFVKE